MLHRSRRRRLILMALVLATIALVPSALNRSATAAPAPYTFNWNGAPASPLPWDGSAGNWDLIVHTRDGTSDAMQAMQAQHGSDCSPPPATHPVSDAPNSVFICRGHLMTALFDIGYGATYLTPPQLVDFGTGPATISYSSSTMRTSIRDWQDLWVTPFSENLVLPLQSSLVVDLQGPPKDAVHIYMDQFNGGTVYRAEVYRNGQPVGGINGNWWTTVDTLLLPSARTRTTFSLDLSQTHLRFGLPNYDGLGHSFYWIDQSLSTPLSWTQGVVQLGHHSYNPTKPGSCLAVGQTACQPNTWHWSNFSISSAVPFTVLRGNTDYVGPNTATQTITFAGSAPTNAFLRFAAIGTITVSLDGGRSWRPAQLQAQNGFASDHFASYWMPVPAGLRSVSFRGANFCCGIWSVRDASLWAQAGSGSTVRQPVPPAPPTPVPVITSAPVPAPTPVPPATHPSPARAVRGVGINAEPAMRPWRYVGPNPDGWWDPTDGKKFIDAEMALADRLHVQTVRVEFPWWIIEPAAHGVYDWTRADYIVASAAAHHLRLQPVIVWAPRWAATSPSTPPSPADFGAFVTALASRYQAAVHDWELWNEPDLPRYFTGTEEQYVNDILIPGSQAIRAVDRTARVITGGTSSANCGWIGGLYRFGARGSFDIVAFHDYASGAQVNDDAVALRRCLVANGDAGRPIWLGEFGMAENTLRDAGQQALLSTVLTSSSPIAMAQWYGLRDDFGMTCCPAQVAVAGYWGLVQHDDVTLKDGFSLLQRLITQLTPPASPGGDSRGGPVPSPTGDGGSTTEARPTAAPQPTPSPSPRA